MPSGAGALATIPFQATASSSPSSSKRATLAPWAFVICTVQATASEAWAVIVRVSLLWSPFGLKAPVPASTSQTLGGALSRGARPVARTKPVAGPSRAATW